MLSKKYLNELMSFIEEKEAKEAKEPEAKEALGKFVKEKRRNNLGDKINIDFLLY